MWSCVFRPLSIGIVKAEQLVQFCQNNYFSNKIKCSLVGLLTLFTVVIYVFGTKKHSIPILTFAVNGVCSTILSYLHKGS